jgi:putative hydrolase of the HAD superfamily
MTVNPGWRNQKSREWSSLGRRTPMESHPTWSRIRGIVLDAVGTLIAPRPSVAEAYAAAAARQGIDLDPHVVRRRFRQHFSSDDVRAERGEHSTDEATERRRWQQIVIRVLSELPDQQRAFEELWDHFARPDSWRAYPDAAPALDALAQQGIAVCIGSNFDGRLRGVVDGLPELKRWANVLVISSEVGYRKPHARFFAAACTRLGMPASRVLCVGDDLENDVRGAVRAGLSGLLLDRSAASGSPLPYVPDLTALLERKLVQT